VEVRKGIAVKHYCVKVRYFKDFEVYLDAETEESANDKADELDISWLQDNANEDDTGTEVLTCERVDDLGNPVECPVCGGTG